MDLHDLGFLFCFVLFLSGVVRFSLSSIFVEKFLSAKTFM